MENVWYHQSSRERMLDLLAEYNLAAQNLARTVDCHYVEAINGCVEANESITNALHSWRVAYGEYGKARGLWQK